MKKCVRSKLHRLTADCFSIEGRFLCPPWNPFSRVDSLRGENLSDGSRESQLACGEIHVFYDAYQFRDVECFSRYVNFTTELIDVSSPKYDCLPAFLPSSFAMYFVTLASAFNMEPPSSRNPQRTLLVTTFFAIAAIVGWPFALALSIPFVVEELFLYGGDIVPAAEKSKWMVNRWLRFARSIATAALIFVGLIQSSAPYPADLPL